MEVKPGYKQTEIGVIPDDWEIKTLGDLSRMLTGRTPPTNDKSNYGHDFLFVGPGDLGQAKYIEQSEKMLSCKGFSKAVQIPTDSIMITCIGSTIGKVGVAAKPLATNQQINSIVPSTSYDSDFLYYILLLNVPLIRSMASEQAVPIINKTNISSFKIPCPPLPEQKRICEPINDIDSLITSIEKQIEKKKLIKQGVMQELFTGKRRLPGFSREWETKRLGDSLVFERPDKYIYWGKELKPQGAIPVLTANKSFILGYANEYAGVYNDVPAIIFDDFTTDCKYVRFPFKVKSSAIKILKPANHDVDLRFIFYTMQSTKFSIGDHKRYYISEYQHLKISLPKIDEQAAIADVIEDIEIEIDLHVKQLNKHILLKQAMMQELLTGRIRLV